MCKGGEDAMRSSGGRLCLIELLGGFLEWLFNSNVMILTEIANTLIPSGSPSTYVTQLTFSSGNSVCRGNMLAMVLRIVERRVRSLKLRVEAIERQVCGWNTRSARDALRKITYSKLRHQNES